MKELQAKGREKAKKGHVVTAMSRLGMREEEDKAQAEHGPDKAEVLGPTWSTKSLTFLLT